LANGDTCARAYGGAVQKQWAESSWAKGIAKKAAKTKLSDFDRFKVMVARKTVSIGHGCVGGLVTGLVLRWCVFAAVCVRRCGVPDLIRCWQRARVVNTHMKKMLKK